MNALAPGLLRKPAPYCSRVGPVSGLLASGATVTSGVGAAPHWIWTRSGLVTGLWLSIDEPVVGTRESNLAGMVLQIWIDAVAHGTAGADAALFAGPAPVVDAPFPLLAEMGKGWEFVPFGERVDRQGREWVWALTNNTGHDVTSSLWVQFEADQ